MLLFTLITGLASVISLFLPFIKNLQKWKIYFYYLGLLFLGVTIGIMACMSEKSLSTINSDQLISLLTTLAIVSVIALVAILLIKRERETWGYIVFACGLGVYLPMSIDKLNPHKNEITSSELLYLIKNDENKGDFSRAIELLTYYKKRIEENDSKDSSLIIIDKRISELKRKQLK